MPVADPNDFKAALGAWAAGVTIVTTKHRELVYGLTASSFSSLSVDPLLVLVCVANSNLMSTMVQDAKLFAVTILAEGQEDVSQYFAKHGREPAREFESLVEWHEWHTGAPIIKGGVAHLDCELEATFPGGDHTIVVGRVVGAAANPGLKPLIYYRRAYRSLKLD
ncbi:MAG: flavin reductase family protein [Dehalococcoidia bacterium]|nr:flavin reductase family protein [Dehalococcoidia bacterium]